MKRWMRVGIICSGLLAVLSVQYVHTWLQTSPHVDQSSPVATVVSPADQALLRQAITSRAHDQWVTGTGKVTRILADDMQGSRHQRFLIDVDGTSILVAHNIDIAPRVNMLSTRQIIAFRGAYIWNAKGGVVHWTHRDPKGDAQGGWIDIDGQRYQ